MTKAAIVIGVDKTGDLPVLKDAAAGAGRVAEWLKGEGYQTQTLVDEEMSGVRKPVRANDVFAAVSSALAPGTCEQLVICFSGHGYLNDGSEHWLLSDAPANPNEAINVEENIQLARDCGVPNVIFVSDACRSTPQSIKADRVRGTLIFPNTGVNPTSRADVDRFFACLPGDPAYEVAVDKSSGVYRALFTRCLREAHEDTPKELTTNVNGVEVLSNRRLRRLLPALVEARARQSSMTLFQKPDAIVESEPDIYLGRVQRPPALLGTRKPAERHWSAGFIRPGEPLPEEPSWRSHGDDFLAAARGAVYSGSPPGSSPALQRAIKVASQLADANQLQMRCGFGVRGADIIDVYGLGCQAKIVNPGTEGEDRLVQVTTDAQMRRTPFARTVLLRFDNGDGAALPAIEGYVATIVVDRDSGGDGPADGIVQVAYTPSPNNTRYGDFQEKRSQIESLRALVAGLARNGILRFDKSVAQAFAQKIRIQKALDPAFGIYASYAYNDAGLIEGIKSVESLMRIELMDEMIYDIALLLRRAKATDYHNLFPCCPMLSQGWALLRVLGGDVPTAVRDAAQYRRASLWTTFKPAGADILFNAARNGALQ